MRHTTFTETMRGTARLDGEERPRGIRLDLRVDLPSVLTPWYDRTGSITGRMIIDGVVDDGHAAGTLHVAPLVRRRIRYRLDATADDGRPLHLDGWKSITPARPLTSMTRLPVTITDADGAVVATARLRFDLRRDLLGFLASFRFPHRPDTHPRSGPAPGGPPPAPRRPAAPPSTA